MARSMTGYGKGEACSEKGCFSVEIRSVNHRYGEISIRMPRVFLALENDLKKQIGAVLKRGKIDVYVQWVEAGGEDTLPQLDMPLAKGYFRLFSELAAQLGKHDEIPLSLVVAQKGVIRESDRDTDESELQPLLTEAAQKAVSAIDAMRIKEGEALKADLAARRLQIAVWVEQIREKMPAVAMEYQAKLKSRLDQLLGGAEIDAVRMMQEVALMADRCDVTEELVRLQSHFKQFDDTLRLKEPIGRKLDFLMQEMNRETNTIGSKSSDAEITSLVVAIKAEMEKMREQVQNIE